MPPRNLLVCFDAFGTLFKPRYSIAAQYGDVARSFGLGGFSNDDVGKSFREAYKREAKQNPNFGKANGMTPEIWWTSIITNTFRALVPSNQGLPNGMVHKLLHRFWCDEGYVLFDDVQPLIKKLRLAHKTNNTRVVIGVITNSDDRVPDILQSLGMTVRPLRYSSKPQSTTAADQQYDFDFSVMSYDVGHEKPDKRIFLAAEEMLKAVPDFSGEPFDANCWSKLYIGDEYDKDVVGALNADWNAVLIDRETPGQRADITWLDYETTGDVYEIFKTSKAVGCGSLERVSAWLPSGS